MKNANDIHTIKKIVSFSQFYSILFLLVKGFFKQNSSRNLLFSQNRIFDICKWWPIRANVLSLIENTFEDYELKRLNFLLKWKRLKFPFVIDLISKWDLDESKMHWFVQYFFGVYNNEQLSNIVRFLQSLIRSIPLVVGKKIWSKCNFTSKQR